MTDEIKAAENILGYLVYCSESFDKAIFKDKSKADRYAKQLIDMGCWSLEPRKPETHGSA